MKIWNLFILFCLFALQLRVVHLDSEDNTDHSSDQDVANGDNQTDLETSDKEVKPEAPAEPETQKPFVPQEIPIEKVFYQPQYINDDINLHFTTADGKFNSTETIYVEFESFKPKAGESEATYEKITKCITIDTTIESKCQYNPQVFDIDIKYNDFKPETKFLLMATEDSGTTVTQILEGVKGKSADGNIEQLKRVRILGLSYDVLVFPKFSGNVITTAGDTEGKLEVSVLIENNTACKVIYNNYIYGSIAGTESSLTTAIKTSLDLDIYIPHYEIVCGNKPSFVYNLYNDVTKNFEENKLQYYIKKSTKSSHQKYLYLKFQNSIPDEMCYFRVKSALKKDSERKWESNCDTKRSKCIAPCRYVRMKMSTTIPKIVKVLIQRIDQLNDSPVQQETATELHWVFTINPFILNKQTNHTEVTLSDLSPSSISGTGEKFTNCLIKSYHANKLKPTSLSTTKCNGSTDCGAGCADKRIIETFDHNKPYLIEISDTSFTEFAGFTQKLYIKSHIAASNDNFTGDDGLQAVADGILIKAIKIGEETTTSAPEEPEKKPESDDEDKSKKTGEGEESAADPGSAEQSEAVILAGSGGEASEEKSDKSKEDKLKEITCRYFASPNGKHMFKEVDCVDSSPCRGFCVEDKVIIGLDLEEQYEIKVVASEGFGSKVYTNYPEYIKPAALSVPAIAIPVALGVVAVGAVGALILFKNKSKEF